MFSFQINVQQSLNKKTKQTNAIIFVKSNITLCGCSFVPVYFHKCNIFCITLFLDLCLRAERQGQTVKFIKCFIFTTACMSMTIYAKSHVIFVHYHPSKDITALVLAIVVHRRGKYLLLGFAMFIPNLM